MTVAYVIFHPTSEAAVLEHAALTHLRNARMSFSGAVAAESQPIE
jgi:hypothetical protein